MLFAMVAHEKLLHFQAARVPPRDSHQKWVRSRAAHKAGGLRVEKQPLPRVGHFVRRVRQQAAAAPSHQAVRQRVAQRDNPFLLLGYPKTIAAAPDARRIDSASASHPASSASRSAPSGNIGHGAAQLEGVGFRPELRGFKRRESAESILCGCAQPRFLALFCVLMFSFSVTSVVILSVVLSVFCGLPVILLGEPLR